MTQFHFPTHRTRIVATIGPASRSRPMIERLLRAGLNVARINFAHGDLDGHREVIRTVRAVAGELGRRVAIMGDLPGPKMRIGALRREPIELERGQPFVLRVGAEENPASEALLGDETGATMEFEGLVRVVKPGDNVYLNDGYVQLRVDRVALDAVYTTVVAGGELRSNKGVNFPGIDLGISAFTPRDRELLAFAAAEELDAVSQSFVSGPEDIMEVRTAAQALGYDPMIIAKIERAAAVKHIDAILQVAQGIMVARGDLGVEIPVEEVAAAQKHIILRAKLAARPTITATQMLESMTHNRRPTRAEVSDVTNAILDGSDAVMLSGETAVGDYPDEAVGMMARIARVAEQIRDESIVPALLEDERKDKALSLEDHVSLSTFMTVQTMQPDLIFAVTATGGTARRMARYPLPSWLVAFSPSETACQRLQFVRGVYTVLVPAPPPSWAEFARSWVHDRGLNPALGVLTEGGNTLLASGATRVEIIDLRR